MKKVWIGIIILIICSFVPVYVLRRYSVVKQQPPSIPHLPQRIVSLSLVATEILFDLEAGDRIVGVIESPNNPPQAKEKVQMGKTFGHLNIEMVVGLEPDLVFSCHEIDANKTIEKRGIPVFIVDTCNSLDRVIVLVRNIGKIVGKESEAEVIALRMQERIDNIVTRVRDVANQPLVYFAGLNGTTRGPGSLTHNLITLAGGINLAKDEPVPFPLLSTEYIIEKNPDIIIVDERGGPSIEEIKRRDGWQNIKAVKNNRIYKSPKYFTNYTPRCIEGLEQFARWFHPQIFKE